MKDLQIIINLKERNLLDVWFCLILKERLRSCNFLKTINSLPLPNIVFLPTFLLKNPGIINLLIVTGYFCRMIDRRKILSIISSGKHCQRFLPSQILDILVTGFEPIQTLSLDFHERNCAVVISTTPQHYTREC